MRRQKTNSFGSINLRRDFDSFADFVTAAETGASELPDSGRSSRDSRSWSGTDSFDECITLARNGWQGGRDDVEAMRQDIQARGDSRIADAVVYDVAGDEADVDRMLSGEPEFMRRFESVEVPQSGRIVKVVVNITASGSVKRDNYIRRGAAALVLIDALESAGLRCEVVIAERCEGIGGTFYATAVVKRAQDSVDVDTLAFAVAHPSVLRRLIFSLMEQGDKAQRDAWNVTSARYGHPRELDETDRGNVYLPALLPENDFNTIREARAWIAREVARVCGEVAT